MKTLRIIGEILLLIALVIFIVRDSRNDITCEAVYMEHDSSYVFYYDENVGSFVIEPKLDN